MTDLNLALGAMKFGSETDEQTSFAILDRFVDAGGTLIDTANCYSFWTNPEAEGGQSERVIGAWLAQRPGVRDRVQIATKLGSQPVGGGAWPGNREGLSASAIASAAEGSLERLGIDRIDLLWTHMDDRSVPLEETVGALAKLAESGTVARLGASNHTVWRVERSRRIAEANGWLGYTALQLRYSYFAPRPGAPVAGHNHRLGWVTGETLDYVESERDVAVWAYTPLLGGAYTRDDRPLPEAYDHPGTARRKAALAKAADDLGVTRNQIVLAWLTGGAPPVTPIAGVSTIGQLDEAMAGAALVLPPEVRADLDAAV
ncbi:aldo/keto reductase [Actinomadura harenae]|uniref:Aldo/keto reductase n=1 Tax=Actinomadura harenae TaxID=2483351 RepID=A0A3M2M9Z0_9ACTN|nr:aldo/keto reductase [Actinomadura harenae]RMI43948.1 aldo/keto reductase [Actinomadura harenae]